jgi:outer membrane protein TolC
MTAREASRLCRLRAVVGGHGNPPGVPMLIGALAFVLMAAAPAVTAPLTEADAVSLALRNSPQIKFRGHFVDQAEAETEASLAWNNPLLRLGDLRYDQLVDPMIDRRSYGEHPFYHATVGLRWSPPGLGERSARRAQGMADEADARMELAIARRDTTALVRKLHAQILSYDAQIALVKDVIEQREKLRQLVKSRLELQSATLLDQSLTEVDYLDARTQLAELEAKRRGAYDELLIQLALPAGAAITLAASTEDTCTAPAEVPTLAERARAANPRLRLMHAEQSAVDAQRKRRWLDLVPWFDYVQVAYGLAGDNNPSYVAFQLQLTLPILDWKRPHRRALFAREQGLFERIQADNRSLANLVLRTSALQAEQAALVARYREAAQVVEQGVSNLRKALEQSGPTNLLQIVQLQARLLATQRSYLRAQLECKLQQIELDRITSSGLENEP